MLLVVQAALGRGHDLEGCSLKVVPAIRKKPQEVDRRCVLLSGLPELKDDEDLDNFLQAKTKLDEQPKISHSQSSRGVALIRYENELGMLYL